MSETFISILLQKWDDKAFCIQLIKFSTVPSYILATALKKDLYLACEKVKNLNNLLVKRIKCIEGDSVDLKVEFLNMLCTLVVENKIEQIYLDDLVKVSFLLCIEKI